LRRHGGTLNLRRHNPTYRLFLTKRGFLRLGPRLLEIGDQVFVLRGLEAPFILRRAESIHMVSITIWLIRLRFTGSCVVRPLRWTIFDHGELFWNRHRAVAWIFLTHRCSNGHLQQQQQTEKKREIRNSAKPSVSLGSEKKTDANVERGKLWHTY
jgi:hypothetical protein